MKPQSAIALMDAMALMNGQKTISEMIADIPVRKAQSKPHQGSKEIARRKKQLEGVK
jgi:hypothetical protein